MNWTTIMMGLDDLKAKINKYYPKKIIIDTIRGNVFLYIYIYIFIYISLLNLITSLVPVLQFFFFFSNFSIPLIKIFFLFYIVFLLSSPPSTCRLGFSCWSLSHQHLLEVSGNSCKVENYCSSITSTLMRLKS